jgi:putative transposase
MIYALVKANQAAFSVQALCRVLSVSRSGYYDWVDRLPCPSNIENERLTTEIKEIHVASKRSYGMPRIHLELKSRGENVSKKRVARLMQRAGIKGITRRRHIITTPRDRGAGKAPDLVKRQFTAAAINQLWVADITYLPTSEGFLYLAVVIDVFSRKVVGWAFSERLTAPIVIAALNMALFTRKPAAVIHHSDQGRQYTSQDFVRCCQQAGVRLSMGTVGDAYDNAMAESFFATLECELIDPHRWKTKVDARQAVFSWIEGWYNPKRRHSAIDYLSPMEFEKQHADSSKNRELNNSKV